VPLLDEVHATFAALAPPVRVSQATNATNATDTPDATETAVKRWLAARLFGCWIAYQGRGLSTIVRYVRACLDAFALELARDGDPLQAIRRCDRLIVHEASSQRMATLLDDRS